MPVEDKKRGRPPRVHPADHSVNAASLRLLNGYERAPIQIATSSSKQNKRNRALAGAILSTGLSACLVLYVIYLCQTLSPFVLWLLSASNGTGVIPSSHPLSSVLLDHPIR